MPAPTANGDCRGMTDIASDRALAARRAPLSRAVQMTVAACLTAGGLFTGGLQYLEYAMAGDLERTQQIAWGLSHHAFYRIEWLGGMIGSLLLLIGFLGLWQITRWHTPRLTAIGAVVLTWGMSGQLFSDVATYIAQVVVADVSGPGSAEHLITAGYLKEPGMIAGVLLPVIAGMFFGVLLLAAAMWRSGLPKLPIVLLALWPLWDFFGPSPIGPFSTDLLIVGAAVGLGWVVARLPVERWRGTIR